MPHTISRDPFIDALIRWRALLSACTGRGLGLGLPVKLFKRHTENELWVADHGVLAWHEPNVAVTFIEQQQALLPLKQEERRNDSDVVKLDALRMYRLARDRIGLKGSYAQKQDDQEK